MDLKKGNFLWWEVDGTSLGSCSVRLCISGVQPTGSYSKLFKIWKESLDGDQPTARPVHHKTKQPGHCSRCGNTTFFVPFKETAGGYMIRDVNKPDLTVKSIRCNPWYQRLGSRLKRNREFLVSVKYLLHQHYHTASRHWPAFLVHCLRFFASLESLFLSLFYFFPILSFLLLSASIYFLSFYLLLS